MSGGGRHDDRDAGGAPDGDDLMGLLYGELDAEAERAARARVTADPALAGRVADMERTRALFAALPDEEPSPRVAAQLLAHAAQAAQSSGRRAARGPAAAGLWSRLRSWLQPVIAHPGLAAAASLIVVAGMAGVLLLREGGDRAAPPGSRDAPRAPEFEARAGSAPAKPSEVVTAEEAAGAPGADTVDRSGGEAAEQDLGDQGAGESAAGPAAGAFERPRGAPPSGRVAGRSSREESARQPADTAKSKKARRDAVLGLTERGSADSARASNASAAKGPDAPPATIATGESDEESADPSPSPVAQAPAKAEARPEPPRSPAELHKLALSAAAGRRCREVQSLGQRIRIADPAYHEKVFRPDRRLAECLSSGKPARAP